MEEGGVGSEETHGSSGGGRRDKALSPTNFCMHTRTPVSRHARMQIGLHAWSPILTIRTPIAINRTRRHLPRVGACLVGEGIKEGELRKKGHACGGAGAWRRLGRA